MVRCLETLLEDRPWPTEAGEDLCLLGTDEDSSAPAVCLKDWDPRRFVFQRTLPQVTRSGHPIEIYADSITGCVVTGKRFPCEQVCEKLHAMQRSGSLNLMEHWPELVLAQHLGSKGLAGFCAFFGVYQDEEGDVLLLSEYIPGGDLFELAKGLGSPGNERERAVLPVVHSLLHAVLRLHACGVAHCDISLENVLRRPNGEVVLIDFETAVSGLACRRTGVRGKPSYQAPEMHAAEGWDAFSADLFACGVTAYCLVMGNYPWKSTVLGVCRRFGYYRRFGFQAFLQKRGVAANGGPWRPAAECMSAYMADLLAVLLHPEPSLRHSSLGELLSAGKLL